MMNNYILEYYQKIEAGEIIVGKEILTWYKILIHRLEAGEIFYSAKHAKAAIVYIENFCRHHQGPLAPARIRLELWQKAMISVLFGIIDGDGNRQFRECVIVIGRKQGKTLTAASIASCCLFIDGEYGAEICFTAPKLDQARLCYDAFYQMTMKEPTLAKLVTKRRTDIYYSNTNSVAKPIAFSAKKSDGMNISLGICDELASWQGDQGIKFYEVLKSSMGARKQPLLLSITTAGYINDGAYDELMKRCTAVLKGTSKENRLAPFIYRIDDPAKWDDLNELQKANPNLGVSVSYDYMLEEINIAHGSLAKQAEFKTKYCNIKQSSSQAFLDAIDIEKCFGDPLRLEDFGKTYCVGGIDLSRSSDLTSCCVVIEREQKLHVFSKFFLPAAVIESATQRDMVPYDAYIRRGILQVSGENYVDYRDCYRWFVELIEKYRIYPLVVGYDRAMAQYLVQDLEAYGFQMDDVRQGPNLTPIINEFEGKLKDGMFRCGDNDLLKIHFYNSAVKEEIEGNRRRLVKLAPTQHIDGMAALLDALTVRQKWFDEIGSRLRNKRE